MTRSRTPRVVNVGANLPYRGSPSYYGSMPDVPGEPPWAVRGRYTSPAKSVWWRDVEIPVELNYVSVESAIKALQDADGQVIEGTLNVDIFDDYGSPSTRCYVSGQRGATDEELEWIEWQIKHDREHEKSRREEELRRAAEALRKDPELMRRLLTEVSSETEEPT